MKQIYLDCLQNLKNEEEKIARVDNIGFTLLSQLQKAFKEENQRFHLNNLILNAVVNI